MSETTASSRPKRLRFWHALRVLVGAARLRRTARKTYQHRLPDRRDGKDTALNAGCLGVLVAVLFAVFTHGSGAIVVAGAVKSGQRIAAEQQGRVVVDQWFLDSVQDALKDARSRDTLDAALRQDVEIEAAARANRDGSTNAQQETVLRNALHAGGASLFITEDEVPGLDGLTMSGFPAMFGSLALLAWSATLVLQGEGLELDVQRRRHPMWEWLFSHPVPPSAVFLAEMLTPLRTNPVYWSAPLFPGLLYGYLFGPLQGLAAIVLVGVPVTVSTACLGKALEILVMLRTGARWRGALLGVMNWIGFSAGMSLFLLAVTSLDQVVLAGSRLLAPLADLPWPGLAVFLGRYTAHHSSFLNGMLTVWAAAAAVIVASIGLAVFAASAGLAPAGRRRSASTLGLWRRLRIGGSPYNHKELAWFVRDRGSLAQAILLPLTLAAFELFHFPGLIGSEQHHWVFVAGAAVVLGTYFTINLSARSLTSGSGNLWIALTWPQRLDGMLRARIRLWTAISSLVVGAVLFVTVLRHPSAALGIAGVALAWIVFAHSIAKKVVTRAMPSTESGEAQGALPGRDWVVALGTLAFAIGVMTRQWPLAIVAVVLSQLTAAAMWQRLRFRLPFPLDPWSELRPEPPTLMHAMVAISGLVDGGAVFTGVVVAVFRTGPAIVFPIAYGLVAAGVALTAWQLLARRGVALLQIWLWPHVAGSSHPRRRVTPAPEALLTALVVALVVGTVGCLYVEALDQLAGRLRLEQLFGAAPGGHPGLRISIFVVAVFIQPIAEEYVFRGLLYRALDREWGDWRAVLGSALVFASYRPPASILPAFTIGIATAFLFKRTGRLVSAVLMHALFNAMILAWTFWRLA